MDFWQPRAGRYDTGPLVVNFKLVPISSFPLAIINQLFGNGWFTCVVRGGRLKYLIYSGPFAALKAVYKEVTGFEWRGADGFRSYCGGCGKPEWKFALSEHEMLCSGCLLERKKFCAKVDNNQRRLRELNALGSHTEKEWLLVVARYGGVCLCCGSTEITKDHIVPLADGGTNDIGNLQPLCRPCNSSKGVKTIDFRQ